jgi:hypothetical protein
MGLLGLILNHLGSLCIIYAIDVCAVGYDGYYAKGISLRLIYFHGPILYQHYSG